MNRPRRQQRFRHAAEGEGFLLEEFLGCPADPTVDPLESEAMPAGRAHARSMGEDERRFVRLGQRQQLLAVVPRPPAAGESLHIVGNGLYDFWTFVPQMIAWAGGRAEELYVSTWTAARPGVVELLELIDAGAIRKTAYLTGLYFKRRETAVYTLLANGLAARGGRFRAFQNHAKVLLLAGTGPDGELWLTCEGSANLTANPRLEQYVLTNDRPLYEFHRGWMEEVLR